MSALRLSAAVKRVSVAGATKREPKKAGGLQRRGEGRVRDERVGETVGFCGIKCQQPTRWKSWR